LARTNTSKDMVFNQYAWYYYFFYYYRLLLGRAAGLPELAACAQATALARPSAQEQLRLALTGQHGPGQGGGRLAAPNGAQLVHDLLRSHGLSSVDDDGDTGGPGTQLSAFGPDVPSSVLGSSDGWAGGPRKLWEQTLAEARRLAEAAVGTPSAGGSSRSQHSV
jgi:hypothetical protein